MADPAPITESRREVAELALILEREGLDRAAAERVSSGLAADPRVFLRTKVEKELGLSADSGGAALGDDRPGPGRQPRLHAGGTHSAPASASPSATW